MTDPDLGGNLFPPRDFVNTPAEAAVEQIVRLGMPSTSLVLYGRWWQLETWLRELVYVELRAKFGAAWEDEVEIATKRRSADATFVHMVGPDNENPLAYLDYSQLLQVIDDQWDLFEPSLFLRASWQGRQAELKQIRHRIGHVRRAADDDLGRIEQTLRDLERGAFIAISDYNDIWPPQGVEMDSPVAQGWLLRRHADAIRLLDHARDQYDIKLRLTRSYRPWAREQGETTDGMFWHADFFINGWSIDVGALWRAIESTRAAELLVDLNSGGPWHAGVTFSAADDGSEIADAIGVVFENLLVSGRLGPQGQDWWDAARDWVDLDYRIKIRSAWNVVDNTTVPISIFGTGGQVLRNPKR